MQLTVGFGVILISTLVLARDQHLLGGHKPVSADDKENVEAAKTLVKETLEKRLQDEKAEYEPHVTLEEIEVKKQLVHGMIYHLKLKATYNFECSKSGNGCIKKEPQVKTCTAKVYKSFTPSAPAVFAKGSSGPHCS